IRTVGATTFDEYEKHFEKDPALVRRFQPIDLNDLPKESVLSILQDQADKIRNETRSDGYKVHFTMGALELIADKARRYNPTRNSPDIELDVMDAAKAAASYAAKYGASDVAELKAALARLRAELTQRKADLEMMTGDEETKARIDKIERELIPELETKPGVSDKGGGMFGDIDTKIENAKIEIAKARKEGNFGEVLRIQTQVLEPLEVEKSRVGEPSPSASTTRSEKVLVVDEKAVAKAISALTGGKIPVDAILSSENQLIDQLMPYLDERVIGHEKAKEVLHTQLKNAMAEVRDRKGPRATILLDGLSGNGKSTLGEVAARGLGRNFERFYMTEFKTSWKVLGADPGHVNSGEGGQVTKTLLRDPRLVVELAEFNMATDEVKNIFYKAFDDGYFTDGSGRKVPLNDIIFIITINTSAEYLALEKGTKLRADMEHQILQRANFTPQQIEQMTEDQRERECMQRLQVENGITTALQGRLDANIPTYALTPEQAVKVAQTMVKAQFINYLKSSQGVDLIIDTALYEELAKTGYDPKYGARSLKEMLRTMIEAPLSDLKLRHGFKKGDSVRIDFAPSSDGTQNRIIYTINNDRTRMVEKVLAQTKAPKAVIAAESGPVAEKRPINETVEGKAGEGKTWLERFRVFRGR
ncbi:MAG: ATP-dependent Clp protease ATP-binding subunit, partial [Bdellovibrionales bacterium]|nr:ATP-dependent Clp protease ATP-binding subunit [Bdellovibrionales bacterium]